MADGRKQNKGTIGNTGGGRPSKTNEIAFLEKLDNIINSDKAIETLSKMIDQGNFNALKLYMEFRYSKPKETIENVNHNHNQEITAQEVRLINAELEEKY